MKCSGSSSAISSTALCTSEPSSSHADQLHGNERSEARTDDRARPGWASCLGDECEQVEAERVGGGCGGAFAAG